jgi:hypothetical protein
MSIQRILAGALLLPIASTGCGQEVNSTTPTATADSTATAPSPTSGASTAAAAQSSSPAIPSSVPSAEPIDTGDPAPNGQANDYWAQYCVGTFKADHVVLDHFDEEIFSAKAGDRYLISDLGSNPSAVTIYLLYLQETGADVFDVSSSDGDDALPFTLNCDRATDTQHYGVFADVTVYATQALDRPLCNLAAGRVVPSNGSVPQNDVVGTTEDGAWIYEVSLNNFSPECQNAVTGFIRSPRVEVNGVIKSLLPMRRIIGP